MADLENIKRILREDYKSEDRDMINKLAGTLNPFMEQVTRAFDGDIDFSNLRQEIIVATFKVDANGTPLVGDKVKVGLTTRVQGLICVNVRNLDNATNYPTGTPFLSTENSGQIIKINNITNLTANERYELTLLVFT